MPKAILKDVTLYYEVYGTGFPLLLIAGLGSDNSSWLGVRQELSKKFQVIVFDNRGSGRSDIPDKKYSIRQMANDAIKLIDYLHIKKCHVIGHSMGGYIAQELALCYPERIDRLILEGTAPVSSNRNNILFKDFQIRLQRDSDIELWIREWMFWLFTPRTFDNKTFVPMYMKNVLRYPYLQPLIGYERQVGAIISFNASDRIKDIKAKTLVIFGNNDILITPEESKVLAKKIHNSTAVNLEATAHCIHLENPKKFLKAVIDFLR